MNIHCELCDKIFYKKPSQIKARKRHYCSQKCYTIVRQATRVLVKCNFCNKEFEKTKNRVQDFNYCSLDCKNKQEGVNRRITLIERECKCCKCIFLSHNKYCDSCIQEKKCFPNYNPNRTIQQCMNKAGVKRAGIYTYIRQLARKVTQKWIKECRNCGYNKHVETCHIKPIGAFSTDTTVSVVNAPENLVLLCPNCHWEFDKGLINLDRMGTLGIEPR